MEKLDEFLKNAHGFVGKEAVDVPAGVALADWIKIRRFTGAIGDVNRLYMDPAYGGSTVLYNTMIAPPTFVAAVRTPNSRGPFIEKDYGLVDNYPATEAEAGFEWFDFIKLGEKLKSSLHLASVAEGKGWKNRRTAVLKSEATYQNNYGGLIAKGWGTVILTPFERGKEMFLERKIQSYTDEEIVCIEKDINAEASPRGDLLLYWEDVNVGDNLPGLVKGPLNLSDMMAWWVAEAKPASMGQLVYKELKNKPGMVSFNPDTGWPYWDYNQYPEDLQSCRWVGYTAPYGRGIHRVCTAGHLLTDWMGDDGFLRRLNVVNLKPFIYGDTLWLRGKVVDKYKEKIGDAMYRAVDVKIEGVNQLGETILSGTGTAYLPSPGNPVVLPISY